MSLIQDEGALIAVAGHRHATHLAYLGLLSLQHRASAGAGLAVADGSSVRGLVAPGPAEQAFGARDLDHLDAPIAIGRLTGAPALDVGVGRVEIQEPVVRSWSQGRLAVATAGRLTNGKVLRQECLESGAVFAGDTDAETIAALIGRDSGRTLVNRVVSVLHDLRGAYAIAIASEERLILARDPRGYRPLCLGQLGGATLAASEDTALRDLGCEMVRAIAPGEVVIVDGGGVMSLRPFLGRPRSASLADLIDLARDDAQVEGVSALQTRLALGRAIAKERPAPGAGTIVGLPDAQGVAVGYAQALGRRFVPALRASEPATRALPVPADVDDGVFRVPFRASGVERAEVALVVPTLTTGAIIERAVQALRRGGARRVHLRVASPGLAHPDPFGLALPPPETLAAVRLATPEQLADGLGVDSAAALSVSGMRDAIPDWEAGWCDAAWSGELPEAAEVDPDQLSMAFDAAD